jgi:hypothetical protein
LSACVYIPLEQRAAVLTEKGVRVWQEIQRLAMAHDELLDSVVLLGQELWLPHHETDGAKYSVTLRIAVHYPSPTAEAPVREQFRELERRFSGDDGTVHIAPQALSLER